MLRRLQHLTTLGLLTLQMNLSNHQCKEGKNVMMGRKSKIKPGFIPLLKAFNIIPLLIQKSRDVANLDILFAVQFSLLLLILLEINQTIALSSLGLQHKREGETAWHEAMSRASRCSSPASYRGMWAKSGEGHPKGRRGSESGGRSWGISQGDPLAAPPEVINAEQHASNCPILVQVSSQKEDKTTIFPLQFFCHLRNAQGNHMIRLA